MVVAPGIIIGFNWIILILGILADIASCTGGFWGNRDQVRGAERILLLVSVRGTHIPRTLSKI
jgi:hypothetical protein